MAKPSAMVSAYASRWAFCFPLFVSTSKKIDDFSSLKWVWFISPILITYALAIAIGSYSQKRGVVNETVGPLHHSQVLQLLPMAEHSGLHHPLLFGPIHNYLNFDGDIQAITLHYGIRALPFFIISMPVIVFIDLI